MVLLNTFPYGEANDLRYGCLLQSVFIRKALLAYSFFAVAPSDLSNLLRVYFRSAMRFALRITAFSNGVIVVIGISSQKQMIRAYAGRVVALMQHLLVRWYGTIMNLPRQAMGAFRSLFLIVPESAVTIFVCVASPYPTGFSFINLIPESFKQGRSSARIRTPKSRLAGIFSLRPRMKQLTASLASMCYFKSSQDVNLRNRFVDWLGSLDVNASRGPFCILTQA